MPALCSADSVAQHLAGRPSSARGVEAAHRRRARHAGRRSPRRSRRTAVHRGSPAPAYRIGRSRDREQRARRLEQRVLEQAAGPALPDELPAAGPGWLRPRRSSPPPAARSSRRDAPAPRCRDRWPPRRPPTARSAAASCCSRAPTPPARIRSARGDGTRAQLGRPRTPASWSASGRADRHPAPAAQHRPAREHHRGQARRRPRQPATARTTARAATRPRRSRRRLRAGTVTGGRRRHQHRRPPVRAHPRHVRSRHRRPRRATAARRARRAPAPARAPRPSRGRAPAPGAPSSAGTPQPCLRSPSGCHCGRSTVISARLARSRPGSDGYLGRLMPSFTRDHGRQRDLEQLLRAAVLPRRAQHVAGQLQPLDPGDARPPERVRDPDADLIAAGIGGLVPEQDERERGRPSSPTASAIAAAVATGPHSRPSVSSSTPRCAPSASMSRSCVGGLGRPERQHRDRAASPLGDLHGLLDRALLVRADREPDIRVSTSWPSAVTTTLPPTIGTRLTQTRMSTARLAPDPLVRRVEQRRRAGHRDRDRILLAEVLDRQRQCPRPPAPAAGRPSAGACRPTARSPRW